MSNATLSLLLFLPMTFGRKKMLTHNYIITVYLTLRVHCHVIFGGMLECNDIIMVGTMEHCSIGLQESIVE